MKIYSKGISKERIDFIAERRLKGYISLKEKYALVTTEDDARDINELCMFLNVENPTNDFFEFLFSPTKVVSGLKYLLVSDEEREEYDVLVDDFRQSFYDNVFGYYKAGNAVTRAEAVRIVWGAFNKGNNEPVDGVDENELDSLLRTVTVSEDEEWICTKFFELIIKYAVYILMWERRYVYNKAHAYLLEKEAEEKKEEQKDSYTLDLRTVQREFDFLFDGKGSQEYKKDSDSIREYFSKEKMKSTTYLMQTDIYTVLKLELTESINAFCDFFEQAQKANSQRKCKADGTISSPVSMYGFLLFVNYFYYKRHKRIKQKKLEYLIDESNHIGDISDMVIDAVSAATEIVLMLTLSVNDCLDENIANDIFAKKATVVQIDILTLVENMFPKKKDAFNVSLIMEEIKKALNDEVMKVHLRRQAGERINKLKDKDKANIMGSVYMYASSHEEGIKEATGMDVQIRARDKARNYWIRRKKCFKIKDTDIFSQLDMGTVEKMFQYLAEQNMVYRRYIRDALNEFVDS